MQIKRLIMCLFCCCAVAAAASGETLTWQDAVSQTMSHNPSIKKAQDTLTAAKQNYTRSRSNFLPQISATASTSRSENDATGYSKSASLGLSGSLSLFSGFGDLSDLKSREADIRIAEAAYERVMSDALFDLRTSFIQLLWSQEAESLSKQILARRSENLDMIELRYESGREDKGSLLRVQADKSSAGYDLDQAQRARALSATALLRAIGRDDNAEITVQGSLETPSLPSAVSFSALAAATPEYRQAQYNVSKAKFSITSAQSSLYPDLSLSAGTGRSGESFWPDNNHWNVGLTLSLPLFTGGRVSSDISIARTQKNAADKALKEAFLSLDMKLRRSMKTLTDSVKLISVRQQSLEASALQSEIVRSKYMNGLSSYQDWYTIENDYINARKTLLNATRDAALDEAQWRNDLGQGE